MNSDHKPDANCYTVAVVCPLSIELTAARLMLDDEHPTPHYNTKDDDNVYTCGSINSHNVVIVALPHWHNGPISAANLINPLTRTFPNLRVTLLVGIGGGIPQKTTRQDITDDLRLGDVVIGWDGDKKHAVIHWDSRSILPQPDRRILNALTKLESNRDLHGNIFRDHLERCTQCSTTTGNFQRPTEDYDRLYEPTHGHVKTTTRNASGCDECGSEHMISRAKRGIEDFQLHFGTIACVESVVEDPQRRDQIGDDVGAICIEMEAAGILGRQNCLVIRGISDYADSHKNDLWKRYATATAAAVAREILCTIDPGDVNSLPVPETTYTIPFKQNECFTGRRDELKWLERTLALSDTSPRAALWGLGGCGKTALALQFAYWVQQYHPNRSIFWVPAISQETFEDAYQEIGTCLRISSVAEGKAKVLKAVQNKLNDDSTGEWLIIVDNADDADLLFEPLEYSPQGERLIDYLPIGRKGSILFTTRTRKAAVDVAPPRHILEVTQMDYPEAKDLLKTSLLQNSIPEDKASIPLLLRQLAYLPLAIIQATAFINKNGISVSEYTSLFEGADEEIIDILSTNFEDSSRYRQTKNPIATTWHISFNQIQRRHPLAAACLSLMACLVRENIPASLIMPERTRVERLEIIGTLTAYAFISKRQRQRRQEVSFDVHQLVHLASQNWLQRERRWRDCTITALEQLTIIVPFGVYKTRVKWTAYLPHAIHVARLFEETEVETKLLLLSKVGYCQRILGLYRESEAIFKEALRLCQAYFGRKHPNTILILTALAQVLISQGKFNKGGALLQETLGLNTEVHGPKHTFTLENMNGLAIVDMERGNYDNAEKLFRDTIDLKIEVFGLKKESTLDSIRWLAKVLRKKESFDETDEAQKLLRETAPLMTETLGPKSPTTLHCMYDLAETLSYPGTFDEAETIHRETLELRREVLGHDHPDTRQSLKRVTFIAMRQSPGYKSGPIHRVKEKRDWNYLSRKVAELDEKRRREESSWGEDGDWETVEITERHGGGKPREKKSLIPAREK